jgi:DNA-binding NtrC family response regulator
MVVDDEKNIREGLADSLLMEGYEVVTCADGDEAYKRFEKGDIDLIITDLKMPGMSGEEFQKRVNVESPGLPVIILTGHGTVETAVSAMRNGAYDFMTKPPNIDHLAMLVKRALQSRELALAKDGLEAELDRKNRFKKMIGQSASIRQVFDLISRVAPSKANVLITGESGVGKELVADAVHELSPRKDKPFIEVHCAALASNLLESELFGHEKGAFTGAVSRKRGRFELANEGTLFLDEIGEIDQNIQVKLLRVIQEKKFERVGGEETLEVDVRIVAATNKDLKALVEKGAFREDLYFRLNVVNINVPPLRERKDDIPLLMNAFLKEYAQENGKAVDGFDEKARAAIYGYLWPGNIRELRNCVESAVVMAKGGTITEADLPPTVRQSSGEGFISIPVGVSLEEAQKLVVLGTLNYLEGNKTKTAEALNIGRKTLHRRLEEYEAEEKEKGYSDE